VLVSSERGFLDRALATPPDAGKRISHAFRGIATNRWVRFGLQPGRRFSGWVCAQGADATAKQSNLACARDVVS
jgi:hypothetical protein